MNKKMFVLFVLIVFWTFLVLNASAENYLLTFSNEKAFFSDVCGDNVCGEAENSCTCAIDCGVCEGLVPGKLCRKYTCSTSNTCEETLIYGCCGNELCEAGEDYGNCPADCEPTELTIDILEPTENQEFFRGETILVKAKITANGRSAAGSDVNIEGFFGKDILFNDGKHNDEKLSDPYFANSFVIPKDLTQGLHELTVKGHFHSIDSNSVVSFNVNPFISPEVSVNDSYTLGSIIPVSGKLMKRSIPLSIKLSAVISFEGKQLFSKTITSDDNGLFNFSYHSSLIDPSGDWVLTIKGNDDFNNVINYSKIISLSKTSAEKFLNINILNELNEKYSRTDSVNLIIELKDSKGNNISDANVTLLLPLQEELSLIETNPGQYSVSFVLPESFPLGQQSFLINASIEKNQILLEGSKSVSIFVEPTIIKFDLIEPARKRYLIGESLPLKVVLEYSSGKLVNNASVKAVFNDKTIDLTQIEAGIYYGVIPLTKEVEGTIKLSFLAEDAFNNSAELNKRIEVSGETLLFILQENILVIVFLLLLIFTSLFFSFKKLNKKNFINKLNSRKMELMELEKELQKKYFNQNIISKEEYQKTFNEYEKELQKLNEQLENLTKVKK